jgi:hypothetical protein
MVIASVVAIIATERKTFFFIVNIVCYYVMQLGLSELHCKGIHMMFLPCYDHATILFRNQIVILQDF